MGPGAGPLVVVGDALLDRDVDGSVTRVCPDAPAPVVDVSAEVARPGGAGLAAVLAAADGDRPVVLVTALGDDGAADAVRGLLAAAGVAVVDLGSDGATPEKVRVRAGGRSLVRLDRGGGGRPGPWTADAARVVAGAAAVLVADYGRGVASLPAARDALAALPRRVPVVWDPHPAGPPPVPGVHLATPNAAECARVLGGPVAADLAGATRQARALRDRWGATSLVVTMGERGALLVQGAGAPSVVPPPMVAGGDPCGAGDRFAAAAAAALADGAVPSEAVARAVDAATRHVAAGGAAAVRVAAGHPGVAGGGGTPVRVDLRDGADGYSLAARVRAAGGTVVATGGCFDLVHAGHVATLRAARSLGDCLVVCLNSDDSVRRLKGPEPPLQPQADRAQVLLALDCVDAVVTFDDDTPVPTLERLRPHVFAKGGDYALGELPEADALARWDGQAVVLPYLPGRSTTRLVQEVRRRVP